VKAGLRAAIFGVTSLAIVGLVGLMAWALSNKTPVTGLSGFTRLQKPAPEFTLPLLDGGEVTLSRSRGAPVVVNFWASWCGPCRDEAKGLERTWRTFKDEGVLFVGVNVQDTEQHARTYVSEFGVTYPNGLDVDGKITVDYGVIGLPVTFFINGDGVVERRWVGAVPEARLASWVDEMVSGAAPSGEVEGSNPEGFFRLDQSK
jgi:cytochrome c biogenesis protein CcmG/thiol:disulfide interchange protein DsbE